MLTDEQTIREQIIKWLATQECASGETVQYGWFIFKITDEEPLNIESLDFQEMASFTSDLKPAATVHRLQQTTLEQQQVHALDCNLQQYALVSKSYQPQASCSFMNRMDSSHDNDSGWFIGKTDEKLDINDPANLIQQSLYELTINDNRFAPYWLLPEKFTVTFDDEKPNVISPA